MAGPQRPVSAAGSGPQGQLVTVFSPKGGVGKTTLAVNLAIALADKGNKRVCVVDLDLGFGDIAITLQLIPARTIADAVHFESGLEFSVLEPLLTPHGTGISALVAPVQPDARDSIPAALVGRILGMLKQNFDYVVVDTAPTFDEFVLQAFDETDTLLLVTTLDVPDPEERQDRRRDPGPAQLPEVPAAAGAQPRRRQGRALRRGGRGHPGDEDRRCDPDLVPGRQRHQQRRADHQRHSRSTRSARPS